MTNRELATKLARSIFTAPAGVKEHTVKRIQFKGGVHGSKEYDLGGFCERALADHIVTALDDLGVTEASRRNT